jgi:thioredoxin 2
MNGNQGRRHEGSGGAGAPAGAPGGRAEVVACPNCGKRNRVPAAGSGVARCGNCHEPLPWVTAAGDADFDPVVAGADVPVLLDLWAAWCAPCRIVEPGVEEASRTFAGRLKVVKVDVDAAPGVAERFDARSIPTLLVLDRGREVARQVGAVAPKALLRWVEEALTSEAAERPGRATAGSAGSEGGE